MATATTVGDVVVEEIDGRFYLTFSGVGALPGRGGGFRSLEAAKDQARAAWNLRLVERLTGEASRLALSSEATTARLLRAIDGLTNLGGVDHEQA